MSCAASHYQYASYIHLLPCISTAVLIFHLVSASPAPLAGSPLMRRQRVPPASSIMFQPVVHADVPKHECHVSHWPSSVVSVCWMLWQVGDLHAVRAVCIFLTSPSRLVEKAAVPSGTDAEFLMQTIWSIRSLELLLTMCCMSLQACWRVPACDQQREAVHVLMPTSKGFGIYLS